MLSQKCIICNKTFTSYPSDNRKFCSHKCFYVSRTTHKMINTKFYTIWQAIRQRCCDQNRTDYKNYGGRGITVCERWKNSFENFRDDMYKSYKEHKLNNAYTSIDRIKNDGNYNKGNCRWATLKEQCNNRRTNNLLTYKGYTLNVMQWSKKLNISHCILYNRIRENWSIKRTLETPARIYR